MRSPLEQRISGLRSQVRRLLALHGMAWVIAGFLAAVILAVMVDWLFHLSRELRTALLIVLGALVGWMIYRQVFLPLFVRFKDLDIALKIEQRWPGLQDRLASTLQFLQIREGTKHDDIHGSWALREETIRRTLAEVETIDFREVVDKAPLKTALKSALLPVGIAAAFLVLAPSLCSTGLKRLFTPLTDLQWPKQTHLTVVDPQTDRHKLAKGDPFRLEVSVGEGEALPASGEVTYTFDNGEVLTRRLSTRPSNPAAGTGPRFSDRLVEVSRSFTFSVRAGDDVTDPRAIEVVPSPALTHARVRIVPPAYTKEPVALLEPLGNKTALGSQFRVDKVVAGSKIEVEAATNKPVADAKISALTGSPWQPTPPASPTAAGSDAPPAVTDVAPVPEVIMATGGTQLQLSFTAESSGSFGFQLRDLDGFSSRTREQVRFDLDTQPDLVPQVRLEQPDGNRDVTANAVVPITIRAEDDFGLGKVWLNIKLAHGTEEALSRDPLVLWIPPEAAEDGSDRGTSRPVRRQQIQYSWDLAESGLDLQPGSVITISASAADLDELHGPKIGKSREILIRVFDAAQVSQRLDEQRQAIREEVARILEMQKQAQKPVEEASRTLKNVDRLNDQQQDALRNSEIIQRQISGRVADPSESLSEKIQRYLDDLKNLRLEKPDAQEQMEGLQDSVKGIREKHLDQAEQSVSRAANLARENSREAKAGHSEKAQEIPKQPSDSDQAPNVENAPKAGSDQAPNVENAPKVEDHKPGQDQELSKNSKNQTSAKSEPAGEQDDSGKPGKTQPADQGANTPSRPSEGGAKPKTPDQRPQSGKEEQPKENDATVSELNQAADQQRAITDELQKMLDSLGEFETYRGVVQDAKSLLNEQGGFRGQCQRETRRETPRPAHP